MSERLDKQILFSRLLPQLLDYVQVLGLDVVIGEVYRPPETAKLYASQGRGSKTSLHCDKLAADLMLFAKDGSGTMQYLTGWHGYTELGQYWKKLHSDCAWGGDFVNLKDYGHFSLSYEGRR
jgi:hypothetical protein